MHSFDDTKTQKMIAFFTHQYTDKLMKSNYVKPPSDILHELVTKPLMFKDIPLKGTQQFKTNKIFILVKKTDPET